MKTTLYFVLFLSHFSICAQPFTPEFTPSIDIIEMSEEAKIVQVMKNETSAFYQRDLQGIVENWIQDNDSVIAWNKKSGGYTFIRGWEGINAYYKKNIEKRKEVTHTDFNVGDLNIDISGDLAYVIYYEYVANNEGQYSKVPGVKTFKKIDGNWKINSVISFWDYDFQYSKSEVDEFTRGTGFDQYK